MASVIARNRIERLGRHGVVHAIIEILGALLRVLGRIVIPDSSQDDRLYHRAITDLDELVQAVGLKAA
jgi:hypothetical protein